MSKHSSAPARRVWRVSADAPMGEWVDSRADESRQAEPRAPSAPVSETGFLQSSLDLAQGLEVIDRTDSVSVEWFGRWFGR